MEAHSLPFIHSGRPREFVQSQLSKKDWKAYPIPTLPRGSGKGTKSEGELHNSPRASGSWLGKTLTSESWTFIRHRSLTDTRKKQGYKGQAWKWFWLSAASLLAQRGAQEQRQPIKSSADGSIPESCLVTNCTYLKKRHDPSPDSCPIPTIPMLKKLRQETREPAWTAYTLRPCLKRERREQKVWLSVTEKSRQTWRGCQ